MPEVANLSESAWNWIFQSRLKSLRHTKLRQLPFLLYLSARPKSITYKKKKMGELTRIEMKLLTHLRLLPLRLGHPCLLRFWSAVTTRMDNSNEYFFCGKYNDYLPYSDIADSMSDGQAKIMCRVINRIFLSLFWSEWANYAITCTHLCLTVLCMNNHSYVCLFLFCHVH